MARVQITQYDGRVLLIRPERIIPFRVRPGQAPIDAVGARIWPVGEPYELPHQVTVIQHGLRTQLRRHLDRPRPLLLRLVSTPNSRHPDDRTRTYTFRRATHADHRQADAMQLRFGRLLDTDTPTR